MCCVRVEAGRAERDSARRGSYLEQRVKGRLIAEVGEDADHVETQLLRKAPQAAVLRCAPVAAQADAEAYRPHVSSSVGILLRPMRSLRITSRSSVSGHMKSESC